MRGFQYNKNIIEVKKKYTSNITVLSWYSIERGVFHLCRTFISISLPANIEIIDDVLGVVYLISPLDSHRARTNNNQKKNQKGGKRAGR